MTAIVRLGDVGSTNDEALSRLRDGEGPIWVVAERQLAGRGRRGRTWVSEAGNLYASHGFVSRLPVERLGVLPLAAANAVADAVEAVAGVGAEVKWPNDVLVGGAKVAGILIETETGGGAQRVVVGCGVNVAHHPEVAEGLRATHLAALRPGVSAGDVFDALVPAFGASLAVLAGADGVARVRERWLSRAMGIGSPVVVRFESLHREGLFVGLDEAGRLILEEGSGARTAIVAGDVFVTERL